jgi:hypothetical protein
MDEQERPVTSTRRGVLAAAAGLATGGVLLGSVGRASAQTAPGVAKFAQDVGDGSSTSYQVDHNLGTKDVAVAVFQNSDGADVDCDVRRPSENSVVIDFSVPAASNAFRVVIVG